MTISNYSKIFILSALICIMPVSASYTGQNSNTGSASGWLSTQNLLVGTVIGALAFTGYKLYDWYVASKRREKRANKPSGAQVKRKDCEQKAESISPNPVKNDGPSLHEKVTAVVNRLIVEKSIHLSREDSARLRDEVMRNDIVQSFISGTYQADNDQIMREMIGGAVDGAIEVLFPK